MSMEVEKFMSAIQKAERRLGKQSQAVLKAKFNLAVILALQERSSESFPLWRSVVQDQLRRAMNRGFFHVSYGFIYVIYMFYICLCIYDTSFWHPTMFNLVIVDRCFGGTWAPSIKIR